MTVPEILAAQGRSVAQARRERGALYGQLVQNIAQVPGQIMQARQQQREYATQQQDRADTRLRQQGVDQRAGAAEQRAVAEEKRKQQEFAQQQIDRNKAEVQAGARWVVSQQYHQAAVQDLVESATREGKWSPEDGALARQAIQDPEGAKRFIDKLAQMPIQAPSLRNVNPGDVVIDERNPGKGAVFTAPAKPPEPEVYAPGSLADAVTRFAKERGKTVAQLTGSEVNQIAKDHAAATRAPREAPLGPQPAWQWVVRTGADGKTKEVYTNRVAEGDQPATNRVKATEDERKSAGWYGQMSDAIAIVDKLEGQLTEQELYQIQTMPQEGLIGMANRNKLSESAKRTLRAFEQFTEARLRSVSGAAIGMHEYAADRRTYIKQYGETPAIAADRKAARARALNTLKIRAGVAFDDGNNDAADTKITVKAPDGSTHDFATQAEADAFKALAGIK